MKHAWILLALVGCGGSDAPPDAFGSCSPAHDTCAADTICIVAACQSALPRQYLITDIHVAVPETHPNGDPWDADGNGKPDIKVELAVDSNVVSMTPAQTDSLTADFPGPFGVALATGQGSLIVAAKDQDEDGNEESLIAVTIAPVTADNLRQRAFSATNGPFSISFSINPQ